MLNFLLAPPSYVPMQESTRGRATASLVPAPKDRRAPSRLPEQIAAQLPSLSVTDITSEVTRAISAAETPNGIAFVSAPAGPWVTRIQHLEQGMLLDLESLLTRLVAPASAQRPCLQLLLGGRTEAVPFTDRQPCLGPCQRILLIGIGNTGQCNWLLTVLGS
jgi:thiamine phosphate synthase YjbQ (UPF0047 family)